MANTLTAILPYIQEALDMVARELVGFIPASLRNSSAERAALNQVINYPIVPAITGEDITPGVDPPSTGAQTFGNGQMTISKSRAFPVLWTGEEERSLSVGDKPMLTNVQRDQFAQAFRAATNEIESDLAAAAYKAASRAYGTAGTTPFGTANDFSDFSNVFKILDDNGTPSSDRHLVLGTSAMANLRGKQSGLFHANEAGTDEMLRNGRVARIMGFDLHDSAQVKTHTKGTGASYTTDTAGYAVGATAITLITGTGIVLAGDVVTFAGDTNKYVVVSGVSAPGVITLAQPGLKVAIGTSATAMTVGNTYTGNIALHRNALHLVTRAPAQPSGGDAAKDSVMLTDQYSGLVFEVRRYPMYHQMRTEVDIAWGVEAAKSDFIATLLG
jgi:hypothetical protein